MVRQLGEAHLAARPVAWRHDGFPHGVLAVRVLAGRQEAVNVADHGDGAAFPLLLDDGSCHVLLLQLLKTELPTTPAVPGPAGFLAVMSAPSVQGNVW